MACFLQTNVSFPYFRSCWGKDGLRQKSAFILLWTHDFHADTFDRQPIPVNLTRKDLKGELERAISSTYMHQNQGTCTYVAMGCWYLLVQVSYSYTSSIKIGTLSQTPAQILTNLKSALPAIVKHVPGGWDNMQSFQVKTNSSMSLPVWNCNLEDAAGGRWQGLVAGDDSDSEAPSGLDGEGNAGQDGISSEEDSGASPPLSPPPVAPSKKRSAEVDDKPAKKAKSLKDERATTTPKPPKPSKVSALTPKPPTSSIRSTKAVNPADQGSEVVRERKKKTVTAISPSAQAAPIGIVEVEETITLSPKATRSGTKATKRGGSAPGLDVARAVPVRGLAEAGSAAGKNKRAKSSAAVTADDAPTTTASDLLGAKAMRKGKADKGPARESSGPAGTTLASKTTTPRAEVAETTGPLITTLPQSTTPASYSITQDEMKIKRSNASGERKKEKVVKSKPGKSIKDSFLKRK